jgi:hypothetical protein
MKPAATCPVRGSIDAHFRGRSTPDQEAAMRAHLPDCEGCRALYERHLLYDELTRRGLPVIHRLGRGLGFQAPAAAPFWSLPGRLSVAGLAAAAGLTLVLGGIHLARRSDVVADGFTARGGASLSAAPELEMFRIDSSGRAQPVAGWIAPGDELGFAYRNPGGAGYLMVYAVDPGGQIYWFHPRWPRGAPAPRAVAITRSAERQELSEVARHAFAASPLRVVALFCEQQLAVSDVEASLRAGQVTFPGAVALERSIEVRSGGQR